MALWIQNVTNDPYLPDDQPHTYVVRLNQDPPLAGFQHVRERGAAACLRAAADAIDATQDREARESGALTQNPLLEAATLAFYSEVGLMMACDVQANDWRWPESAPPNVSLLAEKLRAAIRLTVIGEAS